MIRRLSNPLRFSPVTCISHNLTHINRLFAVPADLNHSTAPEAKLQVHILILPQTSLGVKGVDSPGLTLPRGLRLRPISPLSSPTLLPDLPAVLSATTFPLEASGYEY